MLDSTIWWFHSTLMANTTFSVNFKISLSRNKSNKKVLYFTAILIFYQNEYNNLNFQGKQIYTEPLQYTVNILNNFHLQY